MALRNRSRLRYPQASRLIHWVFVLVTSVKGRWKVKGMTRWSYLSLPEKATTHNAIQLLQGTYSSRRGLRPLFGCNSVELIQSTLHFIGTASPRLSLVEIFICMPNLD